MANAGSAPTFLKSNGLPFSQADLKWVKNIKRDNGTDWAYMESWEIPEFDLNFSLRKEASASTVKIDEILLLYQRVDNMIDVPTQTYLTHLVTPCHVNAGRDPYNVDYPIIRRVKVIARGIKNYPPFSKPSVLNFRATSRGAVHDIKQLNKSLTLTQIQKIVWNKFTGLFL